MAVFDYDTVSKDFWRAARSPSAGYEGNHVLWYEEMQRLNDQLVRIDEELRGTSLGGIYYDSHQSQLDSWLGDFEDLLNGANLASRIEYDIDQPFHEQIGKVIDSFAEIDSTKIETPNNIGITLYLSETWEGGSGYITPQRLNLEQFLGVNSVDEYTGSVMGTVWSFASLFRGYYEEWLESVNTPGTVDGDVPAYEDYADALLPKEFQYTKPLPLWLEILDGASDVLIIFPLLDAIFGYDIITGDQLTDEEANNRVLIAAVNLITLCVTAGMASGAGLSVMKAILAEVVSDMAATATYKISEAFGAPAILSAILAIAVGIGTGNLMTGVLGGADDVAERVIKDNADDVLERIVKDNADDFAELAAKHGVKNNELLEILAKNIDELTDSQKLIYDDAISWIDDLAKKTDDIIDTVDDVAKNIDDYKSFNKKDFDDYLNEIQSKTGQEIPQNQLDEIENALKNNYYGKLDSVDIDVHRYDFNKERSLLINEWEANTGQKWPTYTEDVISSNGKILRRAGQPYDAHHIIEISYGGDNKWWNIFPASFPDGHQGGIHGAGSKANEIFV